MEEIWKDIEGYEGLYQISNLGRVRSLDRIVNLMNRNGEMIKGIRKGKILRGSIYKGYKKVALSIDNKIKDHLIHRLVAVAFIPNPNNYTVVNHIDENPSNNIITNLEWCTTQHNIRHSLYKRTKNILCIETNEIHTAKEWSNILDISLSSLYGHLQGRTPYIKSLRFKYID